MHRNLYSNPVIAALVMASIARCGGTIRKPCTGRPLVFKGYRSRR